VSDAAELAPFCRHVKWHQFVCNTRVFDSINAAADASQAAWSVTGRLRVCPAVGTVAVDRDFHTTVISARCVSRIAIGADSRNWSTYTVTLDG